ncbi:MAG: VOC family protein [Armatimonadetes bacterium]|nr:VOC family protein [Armatimonadota bacterium]MBX3108019.1 VOC family protein [Fimbriimonadaceae bacterium]
MKLRETTYHVRDLDAAIQHYCGRLGGRLISRLPWGVAMIDIDGHGGKISLFDVNTYLQENPSFHGFPGPKVIIGVEDAAAFRRSLLKQGVRVGSLLGELGDICGFEAFDEDGNAIFYLEDPASTFDTQIESATL